jgi:hypothetical protein
MFKLFEYFKKIKKNVCLEMPSYDKIVNMLYDKGLSFADDLEIIDVIYSNDKTKRFIVLKSLNGFYKYTYEEICICDKEEWEDLNRCNLEYVSHAWWETKDATFAYSFFGTEEEAMLSLRLTAEYKLYFIK